MDIVRAADAEIWEGTKNMGAAGGGAGEFRAAERMPVGMRGLLHANIYFFVRCLRGLSAC